MKKIITSLFFLSLALHSYCQVKTEEVSLKNGAIDLPGTLSYTEEKSPLIIWVHGSGNIDRNGNQQGTMIKANYIQQFREAVNKEGIAFYSYDKRTSTPKNMSLIMKEGVVFKDFIYDVLIAVNNFKDDERFTQIILAGHSQGSLVAMSTLENVDKYISIAGAGETVDKTLIKQITNQNAELGKAAASHFKELGETGTIKEVNPMLMTIFSPQNQPFFKSWMSYDPIAILKEVNIPILIVNGNKDLQVKESDAEALHKANPASKMVIIDKMNHLLKVIEKDEDNMKSYMSPDFKISNELIESVSTFVKQ